MSRPMTREEQAIAEKIGLDVTVYIDRDDLRDKSSVMVQYTLKQAVVLPKGVHDYDEAATHLATFLASTLETDAAKAWPA